MTDRELLELAAKADGRPWKWVESKYGYEVPGMLFHDGAHEVDYYFAWNPLEDDGDALRLAVKLNFVVQNRGQVGQAHAGSLSGVIGALETYNKGDPYAAARRAIVRAAAEIGKGMR